MTAPTSRTSAEADVHIHAVLAQASARAVATPVGGPGGPPAVGPLTRRLAGVR